MKRFFAKQHYQLGKVQKFAGRLRVKLQPRLGAAEKIPYRSNLSTIESILTVVEYINKIIFLLFSWISLDLRII